MKKRRTREEHTWKRRYFMQWETICLNALGQAEYNRTRKLPKGYKGIAPCIMEA